MELCQSLYALIYRLSSGAICLGLATVQLGDLRIQSCWLSPFCIDSPEVCVLLRSCGAQLTFQGLGLLLGNSVHTVDCGLYMDGIEYGVPKCKETRPESTITAGFETCILC
ncbi:hypothetical protein DOTSEDRAFT_75986 [Dothistroma septosporum NZE10]|uniref:Uncharacterized protein n=1 Tax=Dothistroma septosporum (strain NZE10 / CBS 128990) TaxID=675120 RepID=M2XGH1_DOTSN|nr:hypothetical protein DOTSEDRAFT_75986 [Dothistroma septosporum NZE10]